MCICVDLHKVILKQLQLSGDFPHPPLFSTKQLFLPVNWTKSLLHLTRFCHALYKCGSEDQEHALQQEHVVSIVVIENSRCRQTIFALWVDCHHMQSSSNIPNTPWKRVTFSFIMVCLNKVFRGNQKASKTNKRVMFHLCSTAKWGKSAGESQALWLIYLIHLQTDARSVCVTIYVCACILWDCVQYLHKVCRSWNQATLQASDDTFMSLLPFFSSL